jgi:hypothetical protein
MGFFPFTQKAFCIYLFTALFCAYEYGMERFALARPDRFIAVAQYVIEFDERGLELFGSNIYLHPVLLVLFLYSALLFVPVCCTWAGGLYNSRIGLAGVALLSGGLAANNYMAIMLGYQVKYMRLPVRGGLIMFDLADVAVYLGMFLCFYAFAGSLGKYYARQMQP